jgi:phage-related protein
MPWKIVYFPKVIKFINKLSDKDRSRIKIAIGFLEKYGSGLREPFSKKIDRNLFELRIRGQDAFRIFYSIFYNTYYLVHIFKKKSQKIPRKEIKRALDMIKQLI